MAVTYQPITSNGAGIRGKARGTLEEALRTAIEVRENGWSDSEVERIEAVPWSGSAGPGVVRRYSLMRRGEWVAWRPDIEAPNLERDFGELLASVLCQEHPGCRLDASVARDCFLSRRPTPPVALL